MYVAVTAGGGQDAYSAEDLNRQTIEEYLNSWFSTLRLCQLDVRAPFVLYGTAYDTADEEVALAAKRYRELLASHA